MSVWERVDVDGGRAVHPVDGEHLEMCDGWLAQVAGPMELFVYGEWGPERPGPVYHWELASGNDVVGDWSSDEYRPDGFKTLAGAKRSATMFAASLYRGLTRWTKDVDDD